MRSTEKYHIWFMFDICCVYTDMFYVALDVSVSFVTVL
jgi:hypothetical protein